MTVDRGVSCDGPSFVRTTMRYLRSPPEWKRILERERAVAEDREDEQSTGEPDTG